MFNTEQEAVTRTIQAHLDKRQIPGGSELAWNPIPFTGEWGIATSFFKAAAAEVKVKNLSIPVPHRAQEIANEVADHLGIPAGFSRVEAVRGYLNVYFSTTEYSRRVVDTVLLEKDRYGNHPANGQQVMVEYSQPNTHKPLHVGHLRNMILGASICNILEAAGYDVLRVNYPGDTGLHVIKWIWNYLRNHNGEQPPEDAVRWMGDIYTEANQLLEEYPDLEQEMRALFQRWEEKDPEIIALWEKTRRWSLDGFNKMYDLLGIRFDHYYYQSEVEAPGRAIVTDLISRGLAIDERPEGPVIVRIDDLLGREKEKYRVMVVLRSDDSTLYATWDLALAIRKFTDYPDLAKCIYVIDVRQSLHLQQAWKTLEIMGYPWTDRLYHLPYEIVNLPGNVTMKSREGTVVLLEDLLREATRRAEEIVAEKNPELSADKRQAVAQAVGLGAIKYPMLARDNTKIATFDWETAMDFNGQAAPYIQYAHVRANSILRRAEGPLPASVLAEEELNPKEVELIDLISRLPTEIARAAADYKTLHLTNLAYDLARAFNDFYNQVPVLKADPGVRSARLRLVAAARQALANCLSLMGIAAPDVM
jgi:arginyl-tRNA synthetase